MLNRDLAEIRKRITADTGIKEVVSEFCVVLNDVAEERELHRKKKWKNNDEGKVTDIHDNGDETGFWFYAGPGPNKVCLQSGLA